LSKAAVRESRKDFKRFLRYASKSATELEYHLLLVRDKGAINPSDYANLSARTVDVRKMLIGLMKRVEQTL
jgi:four helix bundle protein